VSGSAFHTRRSDPKPRKDGASLKTAIAFTTKHHPGENYNREPKHAKSHLKLLSYNIQAAVASTRLRHYLTQSWKHVLPHPQSFSNLNKISEITHNFDIVALQEVDAGSLRSQFVNQVEYLADKGRFPFWYYQTNRSLGKFAQYSNGLLSHVKPAEITEHKLPGLIPGRGAIMVRFGTKNNPLVILLAHLALGKRARLFQLAFIAEIANQFEHVVLMGDLNCQPNSQEMRSLMKNSNLCAPLTHEDTFPSWRPARKLDYILVTPSLIVKNVRVLKHAFSDHLPIAVDIALPEDVHIAG